MKKINNNKFRGNTVYSLNYKFDSVSAAGKFSGTALDLIKRYNELAKEAQSNGNYVEMEVFRQYAEHYRKIVTEINERKNQHRDYQNENQQNTEENTTEENDNSLVETQAAEPTVENTPAPVENTAETTAEKPRRGRRSLKVVEVSEEAAAETPKESHKRRSSLRLKKTVQATGTEA